MTAEGDLKKGQVGGYAVIYVLGAPGVPVNRIIRMGTEHEREDLPYPPAAADNWANPIDAGCDRNTEYTFFYTKSRVECIHTDVQLTKNVTPTTQFGFPFPLTMLLPRLRSKMAPRHCALPGETGPRFISNGLICHVWPPNDMETCMVVLQAE
jgi:hypothetical protein